METPVEEREPRPRVIDPAWIHVWVHTWYGRDRLRQATIDSLDASDAKGQYVVRRQPKGIHRSVFYLNVLDTICRNKRYKYSLRIEDDTVVNKHFLHNVCTWGGFFAPRFGAGFFCARSGQDGLHRRDPRTGLLYHHGISCHFGGAVIVPTRYLRWLRPRIAERLWEIERTVNRFGPTTSVTDALQSVRLRPYIHEPAIAYIDVTMPSHQLGDVHDRYGPQPFEPEWRRETGE